MKKEGISLLLALFMILIIVFLVFANSTDPNYNTSEEVEEKYENIADNLIEEVNVPPEEDLSNENNLILGDVKYKNEISRNLIESSENFIKSFVNEKDFYENFKFSKKIILEDSNKNIVEDLLIYNFKIESYRDNGKKTTSTYRLKLKLDKDGNIINKEEIKNKYDYLIERGI